MGYEVLKCDKAGIARCAEIIQGGGIVVYPTDTVYGIGCDPCNDKAVERVFEIKKRSGSKALPVLVRNLATADGLVSMGPLSRLLAGRFWPGGLTLLSPVRKPSMISRNVTAGTEYLAVRVPANDCLLQVLDRVGMIVGTSANPSGSPSCASAKEITSSGLGGFDALLDGGEIATGGVESTIVQEQMPYGNFSSLEFTDLAGRMQILRHGAVSNSDLESFLRSALRPEPREEAT